MKERNDIMTRKTGLGKGLEALFQDNIKDDKVEEGEKILKLSINEVEPNRNQPRKYFD